MTKTQKYTVDALEDNVDQFAVYRCVDVAALEAELEAAKEKKKLLFEKIEAVNLDYDDLCTEHMRLQNQRDKLQAENLQLKLEIATGRTKDDKLEKENERLKALIEEILVENVGCTELRNLYRKKMISNQETKRRQVGE